MFQPNSIIAGRYQVIRLVGQGGMSNLYLAHDRKYNNAEVVVKEMTASYSDPKEQQMAVDLFHREAKLLASLNHRHIPKVFDYFQFAGKYYLSMEYIDGVDLAVKLEETKGPLPEKQVLEWGEQVAQVLFYLHKHDPPIVFRDVKPSNIMISSQGVKLIDFGIARHFDQAKKGDTMRIGSPGYAPPEQYAAQTDPRSDIYALGVTLHHALTGRDPTTTSTPFLVPPARNLNPALSEATAAMLARATQLDPSDRYQSVLEMRKDIKHILQRGNQSTRVVGAPPAVPQAAAAPAPPAAAAVPAAAAAPAPAGAQPPSAAQQAAPAPSSGSQPTAPSSGQSQQLQPGAVAPPNSGAPANANQPPAQNAAPKPKKKVSLGRALLAACVFVIVAGGTALATMDAGVRERWLSAAQQKVESLLTELRRGENPEDRLRQSLLSGDPRALLPLFQSSDFQEMSEEKKELFRLNLLAAGTTGEQPMVIHLLIPEGQDEAWVWEVSSAVLGAINGVGGVQGRLCLIVPKSYSKNELPRTLQNLIKEDQERQTPDSFLVLGGQDEPWPEGAPSNVLFLSSTDLPGRRTVKTFTNDHLIELFSGGLDSGSAPTVWGIPGPVPASAMESQTPVSSPPDKQALTNMLAQASSANGQLALLAEDGRALSELGAPGEVLLFATDAQELAPLGEAMEGTATVLSSPFEEVAPGSLRLAPQAPLSPAEARLFDALLLSATPGQQAFHGLTIRRNSNGEVSEKLPIKYRWEKGTWLPLLGKEGSNR
ncbi:MAG: protein kinase [Vulcanimicrobiota bacterium]